MPMLEILSVKAPPPVRLVFFFFNDPPPTEISPLSLHDALPISPLPSQPPPPTANPNPQLLVPPASQPKNSDRVGQPPAQSDTAQPANSPGSGPVAPVEFFGDRKSTRLNSSHQIISYAVFCLKKK